MEHYCNPQKKSHKPNVAAFKQEIERRYPWLDLYMPNPEKSPWHVQAKVETDNGYFIFVNFWPCALKAQRDGEKAVSGVSEIRSMIAQLIDDCRDRDQDDEVIE